MAQPLETRGISEVPQEHWRLGDSSIKSLIAKIDGMSSVNYFMFISEHARDILPKVQPATITNISTVGVRLGDVLGNNSLMNINEILERAPEAGLTDCPAEVALQKIIRDAEQKPSRVPYSLFLAMEPIADRIGHPGILKIFRGSDGNFIVDAHWVNPEYPFYPDHNFLFGVR